MFDEFFESIKEIQKQMAELAERVKPGIERFEKNLKPTEDKLIQSGWTINMNMMPYHINEIGEMIDVDQINDYFYDFYMSDEQSEFKILKNKTRNNINNRLLKPYEEGIFAYDNQKYIICINTLIPILEGTIADLLSYNGYRMIGICKEQLARCSEHEASLNRMDWNVNIGFIEKLYCPAPFDNTEPIFLNRNWLMHGRSGYDIKEIDCLRVLNAIGTFCDI